MITFWRFLETSFRTLEACSKHFNLLSYDTVGVILFFCKQHKNSFLSPKLSLCHYAPVPSETNYHGDFPYGGIRFPLVRNMWKICALQTHWGHRALVGHRSAKQMVTPHMIRALDIFAFIMSGQNRGKIVWHHWIWYPRKENQPMLIGNFHVCQLINFYKINLSLYWGL